MNGIFLFEATVFESQQPSTDDVHTCRFSPADTKLISTLASRSSSWFCDVFHRLALFDSLLLSPRFCFVDSNTEMLFLFMGPAKGGNRSVVESGVGSEHIY